MLDRYMHFLSKRILVVPRIQFANAMVPCSFVGSIFPQKKRGLATIVPALVP